MDDCCPAQAVPVLIIVGVVCLIAGMMINDWLRNEAEQGAIDGVRKGMEK